MIPRDLIYEYSRYKGHIDYLYPLLFLAISYIVYENNSLSFFIDFFFILFFVFAFKAHMKLLRNQAYSEQLVGHIFCVFLVSLSASFIVVTVASPFLLIYVPAYAVFAQVMFNSGMLEMNFFQALVVLSVTVFGIAWLFRSNFMDLRRARQQDDEDRNEYILKRFAVTFSCALFTLFASIALEYFGIISFSFTIGSIIGFFISFLMFPLVVTIGAIKGLSLVFSTEGNLVCHSLDILDQLKIFDGKDLWKIFLTVIRLPGDHPELFKIFFGSEPYDHWSNLSWNGSMNFATYTILLIGVLFCIY